MMTKDDSGEERHLDPYREIRRGLPEGVEDDSPDDGDIGRDAR